MAELTNEQIELIVKIAQRAQPMFGNTAHGGPGDNDDIIKAIKESDEKAKALSKEESKLYDKLRKELNIKDEIKSLHDVLKIQDQSKKYAIFAQKISCSKSFRLSVHHILVDELVNTIMKEKILKIFEEFQIVRCREELIHDVRVWIH